MSLLILKEKHGNRHFSFVDERDLQLLASYIVRERNDEQWYEDAGSLPQLQRALQGDLPSALEFLRSRSNDGYEYERFETVETQTAKGLKL